MKKINLISKYKKITEHWSPKVVAEMNDYQFKLAKIKNDFIWHSLSEGEMIVVPKGKKHRPYADKEAKIMLIEPKGVRNTGDIVSDLTSDDNQWI